MSTGDEGPDEADLTGPGAAAEELLPAVRLVRRGAGRPALAAALDWDDRVYHHPIEAIAERYDARPEDVRMLTLALITLRAQGLDPRLVAAFTDPGVSDRAVVACWSAGLSASEIEGLVRDGAVPDEATLLALTALQRSPRR